MGHSMGIHQYPGIPIPGYSDTRDEEIVLKYIKGFGKNETLSIEDLTPQISDVKDTNICL